MKGKKIVHLKERYQRALENTHESYKKLITAFREWMERYENHTLRWDDVVKEMTLLLGEIVSRLIEEVWAARDYIKALEESKQ